jgi:hypothetical protein
MVSAYIFVAAFITRPTTRLFAYALGLLSGGLGIWVSFIQSQLGVPEDQIRPFNSGVEITAFGTLWVAPHLALGLAATLLGLAFGARAVGGNRRALLALGVDILVLGLVHPFNLPVVLTTFGVYALYRMARTPGSLVSRIRASAWPIATTAVAGIVGTPIGLYNAITFSRDPFWGATYGAQNAMTSPPPWELPLDCGIVMLLAPFGLYALARSRNPVDKLPGTEAEQRTWDSLPLLVAFIIMTLAWMYVPVPYQRRFAVGLSPALAVFAALGWPLVQGAALALTARLGVAPNRQRLTAQRLTVYPLLIFGFTATTFVTGGIMVSAIENSPIRLYFVDRDTYQVGRWLEERSGPDDVVVGSYETGNVLGGMLPGRVVLGNMGVTPNGKEKNERIQAMYRGELSPDDTRAFLRANRVSYLIVSNQEREIGSHDPGAALGFPIARQVGSTTAYRVPA